LRHFKTYTLTILCVLCLANLSYGQQLSVLSNTNVHFVNTNHDTLANVFAGGMNASQFGKIKLNADNIDDLVVFDRSSGVLSTFLAEKNTFIHHPEYQLLFPPLSDWVLVKDYNADGKADLFTHTAAGIKVYQNCTETNGMLQFKLVKNPLLSKGFSGMINLQINASDIPALADIDNDGDIDLVCFNFYNGSQLEYHLNNSIETYGHADSLIYKRVDDCWGGAEEIACGNFNFGLHCETKLRTSQIQRIQHVAASTLLAINLDGDGDQDLWVVKDACTNIGQLLNKGTASHALFNKIDTLYPDGIRRPQFPMAAASFYEDINFDDLKDLIVSTNAPVNTSNRGNYSKNTLVYQNTGSNAHPSFQYRQADFLQESMLDVGENATPAFVDFDGDADLDLLLGNRGKYDSISNRFYSTLQAFQNIGSVTKPVYTLLHEDYWGLSKLNLTNIKPYFTDLNHDLALDLVLISADNGLKNARYFLNTATKATTMAFDLSKGQVIVELNIKNTDNFCFADLNADGYDDLLIGKTAGNIEYWLRKPESIAYNLVTANLGGLNNSSTRSCPSPACSDIDQDGILDLMISDNSGYLYWYSNLPLLIQNNALPKEDTIATNAEKLIPNKYSKIGYFPTLTLADLNHNSRPELFIGNAAGGLISFTDTVKVVEKPTLPSSFKIYPNPSTNQLFTIETVDETLLDFYDVTGKNIINSFVVPALSKKEYTFSTLQAGIYLLRIQSVHENKVISLVVW
jgi:hypothetical protein